MTPRSLWLLTVYPPPLSTRRGAGLSTHGQARMCGTKTAGRSWRPSSGLACRPVMVVPISSRNASRSPSSISKTGSGSTGTNLPSRLVIRSISWPQNLHSATGRPHLRRRGKLLHHAPLQQSLSHTGGEKRHAQQAVRVCPFQAIIPNVWDLPWQWKVPPAPHPVTVRKAPAPTGFASS